MEVYYKPSDIVWVKLGPFWWPGEVVAKTSVPEDLLETLKKEPVAIVKFFDEEGYFEFVKSPEGIFPYNCERKLDFIKKGMDAFRAKNPKMTSFPKDVSAAEVKTGGNANILSDPALSKERKRNYASEIFGSPNPKKLRESNKARNTKSEPIITHRRFLGYDDYQARVLIPTVENADQDDAAPPAATPRTETFNRFTCPVCQFSSDRLGILMKHTSCHVKEVSFQSRQPIKKTPKRKRKKALSDEDLPIDEMKTKAKRKSTKKKTEETILADDERSETDLSFNKDKALNKYVKKAVPLRVEEKKDICNDIIADWDDESNHEEDSVADSTLDSTLNEKTEDFSILDSSFSQPLNDDMESTRISKESSEDKDKPTEETDKEISTEESDKDKTTEESDKDKSTEETDKILTTEKDPNKSCFDFEEDEEETKIPDAASGRKIPRVIPVSDRRKTFEMEEDEEEERRKKKILEESEELAKLTESSKDDDDADNLDKTYQSLMESTENLDIPDVPNLLKNEQNFHSAKTVKYPDKTSDLIEPEGEEKIEETVVVSENSALSSTVEDQPEPEEEKKSTNDDLEPKSKAKHPKKNTRSSRSKLIVTESDIDALMLKQKNEDTASKKEETVEIEVTEVPLDISSVDQEVLIEDIQIPNESLEEDSLIKKNEDRPVVEKRRTRNQKAENKEQEEQKTAKEELKKEDMKEVEGDKQKTETTEEVVIEKATIVKPGERELPVQEPKEKPEDKIEIDTEAQQEDKYVHESKRRKTTKGYLASSKTVEDSPQRNRRGRSGDAELVKIEERRSSSLEKTTAKDVKKSRRSTRWDKIEEASATTLNEEKINDVTSGKVHVSEEKSSETSEYSKEEKTVDSPTNEDVGESSLTKETKEIAKEGDPKISDKEETKTSETDLKVEEKQTEETPVKEEKSPKSLRSSRRCKSDKEETVSKDEEKEIASNKSEETPVREETRHKSLRSSRRLKDDKEKTSTSEDLLEEKQIPPIQTEETPMKEEKFHKSLRSSRRLKDDKEGTSTSADVLKAEEKEIALIQIEETPVKEEKINKSLRSSRRWKDKEETSTTEAVLAHDEKETVPNRIEETSAKEEKCYKSLRSMKEKKTDETDIPTPGIKDEEKETVPHKSEEEVLDKPKDNEKPQKSLRSSRRWKNDKEESCTSENVSEVTEDIETKKSAENPEVTEDGEKHISLRSSKKEKDNKEETSTALRSDKEKAPVKHEDTLKGDDNEKHKSPRSSRKDKGNKEQNEPSEYFVKDQEEAITSLEPAESPKKSEDEEKHNKSLRSSRKGKNEREQTSISEPILKYEENALVKSEEIAPDNEKPSKSLRSSKRERNEKEETSKTVPKDEEKDTAKIASEETETLKDTVKDHKLRSSKKEKITEEIEAFVEDNKDKERDLKKSEETSEKTKDSERHHKSRSSSRKEKHDKEETETSVADVKHEKQTTLSKSDETPEKPKDEKHHKSPRSSRNEKNQKEEREIAPSKSEETPEKSKDYDKYHKSHRSSRKDKKTSHSDKDVTKDEPTRNESSYRSSRSGRRSSRHEKDSRDASKSDQMDINSSKDERNSKKSSSSKDRLTSDVDIPSSNEKESTTRKSSHAEKSIDHSDTKKTLKESVDDKKTHISSSRSSKRYSRSSRSFQDFLSPERKEEKPGREKTPTSSEKRNVPKKDSVHPELSFMKSEKSPKKDEIDPIRQLFSSSGHVSKTREQKQEELKSIFSFDYDEKDLKKRKTYSHRRKSKQVEEKTEVSSEQNKLEVESKTEEIAKNIIESTKEKSTDLKSISEPEQHFEVQEEIVVENIETTVVSENLVIESIEETPLIQETEDKNKIEEYTNESNESKDKKEETILSHPAEDKSAELPVNENEMVESTEEEVEKKEEIPESPKPTKKRRKPSRWDQKEKTDSPVKEERKSCWEADEKKEEIEHQITNLEPLKDALEIDNSLSQTLDIDDSSQKEMNDIFSKKETMEVIDKNAAQIELIFGSSPLPGSETNVFVENRKEVDEKPKDADDKKEEGQNTSENSSYELIPDLMDSLESQVARITHYEEPMVGQKMPSLEEKKEEKVPSIFDTPEKKNEEPTSAPQSLEEIIDVVTGLSEEKPISLSEETKPESSSATSPFKTKKTHLLTETNKVEKEEKVQEEIVIQEAAVKSNEVATRLTNPKKRFVKSFEDSELIKQKEKSLEAEKAQEIKEETLEKSSIVFKLNTQEEKSSQPQEAKPETSPITGKSPIAFKLKKQILSKIHNIFDEADAKKESKVSPKVKQTKNELSFFSKKKESNSTFKIEEKKEDKTDETPEKVEVNEEINVETTEKKENLQIEDSLKQPVFEEKTCQKTEKETTENKEPQSELSKPETSFADLFTKSSQGNSGDIQGLIEFQSETVVEENKMEEIDISKTEIITKNFPIHEDKKEEPEYVSIDGNLTVVSEKELAEGQVEITASMPSKKPMTLMSFSMDFSDNSSEASIDVFKKSEIKDITESLVTKTVDDIEDKKKIVVQKEKSVGVDERVVNAEEILGVVETKEGIVHVESKDAENEFESSLDNQINKQMQEEDEKSPMEKDELNQIEHVEIEEKIQVGKIDKKHIAENESIVTADEVIRKDNIEIQAIAEEIIESVDNKETQNVLIEEHKSEILSNLITEIEIASSCLETIQTQTTTDIKTEIEKPNDSLEPSTPVTNETYKTTTKDDANDLFSLFTKNTQVKSSETTTVKRISRKIEKTPPVEPPTNEPLVIYNTAKSSTVTDMCDLEDHIPSQIVYTKMNQEVFKAAGMKELPKEDVAKTNEPEMSKLLSRLTTDKKEDPISKMKMVEAENKAKDLEQQASKTLLKAAIKSKAVVSNAPAVKSSNKAIILSEKIIRPAREAVGVHKRAYEDVEDIEPYIIAKTPKLEVKKEEVPKTVQAVSTPKSANKQLVLGANKQVPGVRKPSGKAKILNQTIIRPAGEAIQTNKLPTEDNVDFDINSMPIVLSDEILTPESLESMPIVLGDQAQRMAPNENMKIIIEKKPQGGTKLLTKAVPISTSGVSSPTVRMPVMKRTTPKILQTPKPTQKIVRQMTPVAGSKGSKFVVVSDMPRTPQQIVKKQPNVLRKSTPSTPSSTPSTESTGHKIMILTNQQGKQQRLLLTPAQQKMFSMQLPGKTVMKSGAVVQKSQLGKVQQTTLASTSKLPGQPVQTSKFVKTTVGSSPSPQMKIVPPRKTQKVQIPGQQVAKQKTILITNQQGQTLKKIQGTNDALLDKQVAEQLEAIKVSSMKAQQKQQEVNARASLPKLASVPSKKAIIKRPETKQSLLSQSKPSTSIGGVARLNESKIPPLTPIKQKTEEAKPVQKKPDRPLHQLVIQDNMGNQTTITEGQILALPSETVDGQPQSYMLVTLDETGNLTPLNNEALMSLDPSLAGLTGGDLSNMVLQMDAGTSKDNPNQTAQLQAAPSTSAVVEKPKQEVQQPSPTKAPPQQTAQVQVTCNINGESSQQIILTGDPSATQKFLDSLTDGSTDLANILAGAEGNSFLIQQPDGQQILINTEPSEAPSLLPHVDQQDQGNPMFSTHPGKSQDILAAALADTDVFQQEVTQSKLTHAQLSPGQTLFPMNVGNVLETSLTLNSPIMTPLEVPSTNSKRVPDDDILTTRVPKNVDLPITITDPNISQTVSHQQVLMASDLQSNLELTLPISETSMSVTSDMSSPSFAYSLSHLDVTEHADVSQKHFGTNMPLLTEDLETSVKNVAERGHKTVENRGAFLEEGLCTLGGEMCSSLSEPPPEMFDIPMESDFLNKPKKSNLSSMDSVLMQDENSLEISVQSEIVSDFKDSSQSSDSSSSQDKKL